MSFHPSPRALKNLSASSKRWLQRQFSDPYVRGRLAHPANYRSRAAFKLLELDARPASRGGAFLAAPHVRAVVDLGAAPGGWAQVVAGKLGAKPVDAPKRERRPPSLLGEEADETEGDTESWSAAAPSRGATILALDLLPMDPIPGVRSLQADFLAPQTGALLAGLLPEGKADVVLSDMAVNATGNRTSDVSASLEIAETVLAFCERTLRTAESVGHKDAGVLVMKYFQHPWLSEFRNERLKPMFRTVDTAKPNASRSDSSEAYFICKGWRGSQS